jgi:hypothetical protein
LDFVTVGVGDRVDVIVRVGVLDIVEVKVCVCVGVEVFV